MTEHERLIGKKLDHLRRMAAYLTWSLDQVKRFTPIQDWAKLTQENPARLSEFFRLLTEETPALLGYLDKMLRHCEVAYGYQPGAT